MTNNFNRYKPQAVTPLDSYGNFRDVALLDSLMVVNVKTSMYTISALYQIIHLNESSS